MSDSEIDIEKTDELAKLLERPRDQRDRAWRDAFHLVVQRAALDVPEESDQRVIRGDDGMNYLAMFVPPPDREFRAFSIRAALDFCLENGLGVVIDPPQPDPAAVFSYGSLWSLKSFNSLNLLPPGMEPRAPQFVGQEIKIADPSDRILPPFARKALANFFKHVARLDEPRVLLANDPLSRPADSLVFNFFLEDCPDEAYFRHVMKALRWHIPPHLGLVSVAKNSQFAQHMQPLNSSQEN